MADDFTSTILPIHPQFPAGVNDAAFALDEVNGIGLNTQRMPPLWDSSVLTSPTVLSVVGNPTADDMPSEVGNEITFWVSLEQNAIMVPRD